MTDGINGADINTERESFRGQTTLRNGKTVVGTWYPTANGGWHFTADRKPKQHRKKDGISYLTKDQIESYRIRRAKKGNSKEHN